MSYCQGNIERCEANEALCALCGDVIACSEHGHVDEGAMRGCPNETREEWHRDVERRPLGEYGAERQAFLSLDGGDPNSKAKETHQ